MPPTEPKGALETLNDNIQTAIKQASAWLMDIKKSKNLSPAELESEKGAAKCDEGYVHLFGKICVKKSIKDGAEDFAKKILPDLSAMEDLDSTCRMAVEAMKAVSETAENLLKVPGQIAGMLEKLVDYPFDKVKEMASDAVKTIGGIKDKFLKNMGYDKITGIIDDVKTLEKNLEDILTCPLMADTEIGKAAAEIIDDINEGKNVVSKVKAMADKIKGYANDVMQHIKDEPIGKIQEVKQALDDAIKRSGVEEILTKLDGLAKCVSYLCDLTDTASSLYDKLPSSSDDLAKKAGLIWNSSTGALSDTFSELLKVEGDDLTQIWNDIKIISW